MLNKAEKIGDGKSFHFAMIDQPNNGSCCVNE